MIILVKVILLDHIFIKFTTPLQTIRAFGPFFLNFQKGHFHVEVYTNPVGNSLIVCKK